MTNRVLCAIMRNGRDNDATTVDAVEMMCGYQFRG